MKKHKKNKNSEKWETFKEQMCRVQSKYIPMRCEIRNRKGTGWLSSDIRNVIKEKQKTFIRFKITGLELDLYHYQSKQRQVKTITRQVKREYEKDMAKDIKHNCKALFLDPHGGSLSLTHVVVLHLLLVDFFVSQPTVFIETS